MVTQAGSIELYFELCFYFRYHNVRGVWRTASFECQSLVPYRLIADEERNHGLEQTAIATLESYAVLQQHIITSAICFKCLPVAQLFGWFWSLQSLPLHAR